MDIVFLRNISINTLHKGDDDDDDNNNNTGILTEGLMKNRKTFSRFTTKDSCTWNVTCDT